jgi:predicted transcriptional regulator
MARKASAALTDGEARVMAVLWGLNSATVAQVVTQLQAQYRLTYSTVQTTLRILEQKGYVAHEKVARAFVFRPLVDERQARRRALRHLIGRLFNR